MQLQVQLELEMTYFSYKRTAYEGLHVLTASQI